MCLSTVSPLTSDNHANAETAHGIHGYLLRITENTTTLTQRMGMSNQAPAHFRAQTLAYNRYVNVSSG